MLSPSKVVSTIFVDRVYEVWETVELLSVQNVERRFHQRPMLLSFVLLEMHWRACK